MKRKGIHSLVSSGRNNTNLQVFPLHKHAGADW